MHVRPGGSASWTPVVDGTRRRPRLHRMPLLQPRVSPHPLSPRRPVPASIERPHYVDVPNPREDGDVRVKDAETIEKMRIAGAHRRHGHGRGVEGDRARRHHRRARRRRPRVHARPRRLPVPPRLQGLPQVGLHERQRGHLPRHPGRPSPRGRRHRQHRRHGLHPRRPRRHRRDLPRRRRRRGVAPARRAHPRGDDARHPRGPPRARDQRHRPRHRELRQALRLRRRARLHRPRHRPRVPLRAHRPALRRGAPLRDRHRAGHDVHDRADAQPRHPRVGHVGRPAGPSSPRDRRRSAQFEHTILITDDGNEILTLPEGSSAP